MSADLPGLGRVQRPIEPAGSGRFTDHAGTWITENGWTRREVDGRPFYVRCSACDAPVDETTKEHGWCRECWEIANG